MDKRESPTPEQLRLYRRRKKILQKKRRQRRRALVAVAAVAIVVVVVLVAVLSGSFEKRSNKDMLTLESDGTVVFEENGDMKNAKGLKQFVKSQIMSYNNTNGADPQSINEDLARRDFAVDADAVARQFDDRAVFGNNDILLVHAAGNGQAGMFDQMAIFPVDRHKELRPDQVLHDFQLFLAGMPRHVDPIRLRSSAARCAW